VPILWLAFRWPADQVDFQCWFALIVLRCVVDRLKFVGSWWLRAVIVAVETTNRRWKLTRTSTASSPTTSSVRCTWLFSLFYTVWFIKSGPFCIFAITFSNVDRFEWKLHQCIRQEICFQVTLFAIAYVIYILHIAKYNCSYIKYSRWHALYSTELQNNHFYWTINSSIICESVWTRHVNI